MKFIICIAILLFIIIALLLKRQSYFNNENCIFCLTRGYDDRSKYDKLIARNKNIADVFDGSPPADLILFEEGNINSEDKAYIDSQTPELKIIWKTIPFVYPDNITYENYESMDVHPKGYALMCKFNTIDVWNYLKPYKTALRVDDDCILDGKNWKDVFNTVSDDIPYKSPRWVNETHATTNKTLPEWLGDDSQYYNTGMPYTNVFISRVGVWFRSDVQEWLKKLDESGNILRYRWGDAPLHDVVLKKFKIGHEPLRGFKYFHDGGEQYTE